MRCFRALRVTRNRIPNFSSCLDITRINVAEFLKPSSNFSILPNKFTSKPPLTDPARNRLHWRRRIHAPIPTPAAITNTPNAKILFPIAAAIAVFFELETAQFTAKPIETTADEKTHKVSTTERK